MKLLCMTLEWEIHVIKHLLKPIAYTTQRVKSKVSYGLWVIMMCQGRFIDNNKCTTLIGDINSARDCAWVGTGNIWELYVIYAQFCHEPKK